MGWIDELIEAEFASGKDPPKDPPEERKSKIKKLIREELNKNPVLSNVLRENKAEGKFIKELTDRVTRFDIAITWRQTKQGHTYWSKINDIVRDKLSE